MERAFILGKKITALSFVVIILMLNVWMIRQVVGIPRPQWSQDIFYIGVACAFLGGFMMLPQLLLPKEKIEESEQSSEHDK